MRPEQHPADLEEVRDVCALPLVRRVAAMLDRDPDALREGDPLPRGWHVALFTVPTQQSQLRPDGLAGLGVTLPDLGLPRIMAGGKRTRFEGDIPIGVALRRESRTASVAPKEGRSGRLAVVTIEHRVFVGDASAPALVEEQDYVMLGEKPTGGSAGRTPGPGTPVAEPEPRPAAFRREVVPDETLLLRYCAITFNTHRIHYDLPYATGQEGYPALVVNGGIAPLFLLELFRASAGRQPDSATTRNLAPLFCGRTMRLCAAPDDGPEWRLWAEEDSGRTAVEVIVR